MSRKQGRGGEVTRDKGREEERDGKVGKAGEGTGTICDSGI